MADPINLTPSQEKALTQLLTAVADGRNTALHGPAGTGKTTLTGVLIHRLLEQGKRLAAAAPTHKAVGVIRGRVPDKVPCKTVASLLGLKPVARGRYVQFIADFKQAEKRGQLRGVDVLVVDEASMLSQQLGQDLERLAATTGTVIICVGDASQLPPVDPPPEPGEEDNYRGVMAQAFLNPPGGIAALTEVVRHQGPVLQLATTIRRYATREQINGAWPSRDLTHSESQVITYDWANPWLASAKRILCDPRWEQQPDAGRILCWSNRQVDKLTLAIREAKLGKQLAAKGWQVGEVVANGDAVQQPGKSLAAPLAPSTCEWRVVEAKQHRLVQHIGDAVWRTPKRQDSRHFSISCDLTVQKLKLEPLAPGDQLKTIEVFAPIPGSTAWGERIQELRQAITKIEAGPARTKAWKQWHELRSWCCDLRSAAVLTVHRSQGSTFKHIWIASDLAFCNTADLIPLHYTALTRASKAVHLIKRGAHH
ncbi:AAA family ATPase [Synechococcus sp. HK01-R]|uniref:AAA family ATPase n=1 Tax=Synechococcus sp. HK01-R TaxID=2751171 RepID=UPI0016268F0A|nr:AAA family ATPase [Synechococcus sp. HK01-R]QNG26099.1 AAA family ATPase [Synechococcus sp. HK01-R]